MGTFYLTRALVQICSRMGRALKREEGIETIEVAALVAVFVVVVIIAFQAFGSQVAGFIQSLPGRLGMGG
jgi:Flp pilus assembly pilin Flp